MAELKALWNELNNVCIDDDDCIDTPYLHFPIGTHREDIWHWFEDQNADFIVGEAPNRFDI